MKGLNVIGRNTQGVKLMNLTEGDQLGSLAKLVEREKEEDIEEVVPATVESEPDENK